MARDDDQGGHGAVARGKTRFEKVDLRISLAKLFAAQPGGPFKSIRRVREVGLGVYHNDVGHTVREGRVSEAAIILQNGKCLKAVVENRPGQIYIEAQRGEKWGFGVG